MKKEVEAIQARLAQMEKKLDHEQQTFEYNIEQIQVAIQKESHLASCKPARGRDNTCIYRAKERVEFMKSVLSCLKHLDERISTFEK